MKKQRLWLFPILAMTTGACALDASNRSTSERTGRTQQASTTVIHSTEVNLTVSVTTPTEWDQFKADIDNITGPFQKIGAAVSSTITVINAAEAIAQLLGIMPAPTDPFATLEGDINTLFTQMTWKVDGAAVYQDMLTFSTAKDAISREGTQYSSTDGSYTPTNAALHDLEGVDSTGGISLFSSYGRFFDENVTGATDSDINWKWAIAPIPGKTRPNVMPDGLGNNLVYDWRLAMPALLSAIPFRTIVVAAADPNFRADLSSSTEFDEARNALLAHYKTMDKGIVCGYRTFLAGPGFLGFGIGDNDSCDITCADMYTGLEGGTAIFQQGTCEGTIGKLDVYPKSLAQSRTDVANHMPFFQMDAAMNQLYKLNHPGRDLTEVNQRIPLAGSLGPGGANLCAAAQSGAINAPMVLSTCSGDATQTWVYDREAATVTNPSFGTCLAVQVVDSVVAQMTPTTTLGQLDTLYGYSYPVVSTACIGNDPTQKWTYDPESKRLVSGVGVNMALTSGDIGGALTVATTVALNRAGSLENMWQADTDVILNGLSPVFWGQNSDGYWLGPTPVVFGQPMQDWDYGYYKGQCQFGQPMTGLSAFTSDLEQAHAIDCSGSVPSQNDNRLEPFDSSLPGSPWDWDYGYFKAECPNGYYAQGVSQSTSGALHSILCTNDGRLTVSPATCRVEVFGNGPDSPDYSGPDWDPNFYKGQCPSGDVVAGISANAATGPAGAPHALLCCPP
jgi:hypothetical protein